MSISLIKSQEASQGISALALPIEGKAIIPNLCFFKVVKGHELITENFSMERKWTSARMKT